MVQLQNKAYKNCKNYPKIYGQTERAVPPLPTPWIRHCRPTGCGIGLAIKRLCVQLVEVRCPVTTAKLLFRSCFKTFFMCTFNASEVTSVNILFERQIAYMSVGKPSEQMSNFWMVRFSKNRICTEYSSPLLACQQTILQECHFEEEHYQWPPRFYIRHSSCLNPPN